MQHSIAHEKLLLLHDEARHIGAKNLLPFRQFLWRSREVLLRDLWDHTTGPERVLLARMLSAIDRIGLQFTETDATAFLLGFKLLGGQSISVKDAEAVRRLLEAVGRDKLTARFALMGFVRST